MMETHPTDLTAKRLAHSTDVGELILLRTYQGDASQLAKSIGELRLLRDYIEGQAVRDFHARLTDCMNDYGYMTPAELDRALEEHLEDLTLDFDPREDGAPSSTAA